jgi:hypothetical protein
MTKAIWQAYYFDSFDNTRPPVRTETIQADSEDDAGRIATRLMGRCLRVDVTRPVWSAFHAASAARRDLSGSSLSSR